MFQQEFKVCAREPVPPLRPSAPKSGRTGDPAAGLVFLLHFTRRSRAGLTQMPFGLDFWRF
jgi:hypothetical protein